MEDTRKPIGGKHTDVFHYQCKCHFGYKELTRAQSRKPIETSVYCAILIMY